MPKTIPEKIENFGRAMTAEELAPMLGLSRITIFKYAKRGIIPSFRIGWCVRFDPVTIAKWVREHAVA